MSSSIESFSNNVTYIEGDHNTGCIIGRQLDLRTKEAVLIGT